MILKAPRAVQVLVCWQEAAVAGRVHEKCTHSMVLAADDVGEQYLSLLLPL